MGNKMIIKEIIHQYRRDFVAIYECEHCGYNYECSGYDDANFHENVIPKIICKKCGETSKENYKPLIPKYHENEVI